MFLVRTCFFYGIVLFVGLIFPDYSRCQPVGPLSGSWPMLGGTVNRNMSDPQAKNLPLTWSIKKGATKSVLWRAELGTTTYGGIAVADGKVFIGTNNDRPRDPMRTGDKGAMYCLRVSDGEFPVFGKISTKNFRNRKKMIGQNRVLLVHLQLLETGFTMFPTELSWFA